MTVKYWERVLRVFASNYCNNRPGNLSDGRREKKRGNVNNRKNLGHELGILKSIDVCSWDNLQWKWKDKRWWLVSRSLGISNFGLMSFVAWAISQMWTWAVCWYKVKRSQDMTKSMKWDPAFWTDFPQAAIFNEVSAEVEMQ